MTPPIVPAPGPAVPREAVRRRLPDGMLGDVVGHVLRDDADALVLLPIDGPAMSIDPSEVFARRVVPPRVVRPASSAEAIERLTSAGWPGLPVSRLGGWTVREGLGWTGRANSCLVAGDPGMPVSDALALVAAHYERVGLPPRIQLTHPAGEPPDDAAAAVEEAVDAAGWEPYDLTHVLVTDLRRRLDIGADEVEEPRAERTATIVAQWSQEVSPPWAHIVRGGGIAAEPRALPVLTAVPAHYVLLHEPSQVTEEEPASEGTHPGDAVAAGRLVLTQDWAGLSCIEVVPSRRGEGLGRAVTRAMLDEARRAGARFAYVQVEDGNPALALYRSLGFTPHHRYHYRILRRRDQERSQSPQSPLSAGYTHC